MNVLGLDCGGSFGFARSLNGKVHECGVLDLNKLAKQTRLEKHVALYGWLRAKVVEWEITYVCREDSIASLTGFARGNKGADKKGVHMLIPLVTHGKYAAMIDLVVEQKHLKQIDPVNPMTLKSFAGAKVKGGKDQMIALANRFYGFDLKADEDDAADSAHVCAWALQKIKTQAAVNW